MRLSRNLSEMSTSMKTKYAGVRVPTTPSRTINTTLEQHCGKGFNNPVQKFVAVYVCAVIQLITALYNLMHPSSRHSHTYWSVSCAIVSVLLICKAYFIYSALLASAAGLHILTYYSSILLGLVGAVLCGSGAFLFDKAASKH